MTSTAKPIVFHAHEVTATLAGHKTQFRRVMKLQPGFVPELIEVSTTGYCSMWERAKDSRRQYRDSHSATGQPCQFGKPGDRLWVRETWSLVKPWRDFETGYIDSFDEWAGPLPKQKPSDWTIMYHSDWGPGYDHPDDRLFRWRPSIFMPRWASRITLEVTGVRAERLQSITEGDAKAEGVTDAMDPDDEPERDSGGNWVYCPEHGYTYGFQSLWNQTYGKKHPWAENEWAWVTDFKVVS